MQRALALGLRLALAAALLAPAAAAQVRFTGVVQKTTLPSICQEETHYLECTSPLPAFPSAGVLLKSSTPDLDAFVGKNTRYLAVARGVECTVYDVFDAAPPTSTLILCGAPVPGCPLRFRVGPTGVIGQFWLWMGLAPDFVPLDATTGTWQLGSPFFLLGSGFTVGTPEETAVDIVLPADPGLTGIPLWVQGARRDIGPVGPIELSNSLCFKILGPSPPCIQIDC